MLRGSVGQAISEVCWQSFSRAQGLFRRAVGLDDGELAWAIVSISVLVNMFSEVARWEIWSPQGLLIGKSRGGETLRAVHNGAPPSPQISEQSRERRHRRLSKRRIEPCECSETKQ